MLSRWYALSPLILQWFLWPIVRPLFRYYGRYEVRGIENLRNVPRGALFASNHTSELDAIFIPAALPFFHRLRPFFYTSRERAFYKESRWRQHFYGGFLFNALGAYSIEPGKHDYEKSLSTHIRLAREGMSVIIFPEGRVGHNEVMGEGKGGVAYLSHCTGKPIIPVGIVGTYDITSRDFFSKKRRFVVNIGTPLSEKDIFPGGAPVVNETRDDYKAGAKIVMEKIAALYQQART
jgi:1-acyl-sn-glycerol-3-phosphate acyltransferase